MSDEEIAKRCSLKVSDVRSVLNRLHEYGITAYIRERDKDTGWFSYNWTVNTIKLYEVLGSRKAKGERMEQDALAYEKTYTFYSCANPGCAGSNQRIPESDALLTTYACERCGDRLRVFDNSKIIQSIEEKLASRVPDDQTFIREFREAPAAPKPGIAKRAMLPVRKGKAHKAARRPVAAAKKTKAAPARAKPKIGAKKKKSRR